MLPTYFTSISTISFFLHYTGMSQESDYMYTCNTELLQPRLKLSGVNHMELYFLFRLDLIHHWQMSEQNQKDLKHKPLERAGHKLGQPDEQV